MQATQKIGGFSLKKALLAGSALFISVFMLASIANAALLMQVSHVDVNYIAPGTGEYQGWAVVFTNDASGNGVPNAEVTGRWWKNSTVIRSPYVVGNTDSLGSVFAHVTTTASGGDGLIFEVTNLKKPGYFWDGGTAPVGFTVLP